MEAALHRRPMKSVLAFSLLTTSAFFLVVSSEDSKANPCKLKESCGECISENPECAWCAQEDNYGNFPRCNLKKNLKCNESFIINPKDSKVTIKDEKFGNKGTKKKETIQIKPQHIKLKIRPNSPKTFEVQFRLANNYPVDLYYLMDLSHSMKDDQQKLAALGDTLALQMKKITEDFKLGFGSFIDKKIAPYVNMHPNRLNNPCSDQGCAAVYGFQNNMPLSSETKMFQQKVTDAKTSGNLDGVEGGFDAIMQAIVCKEAIGWRNKSRKLLILSTDNGFHHAGDGKLAGLIQPNDGKCHLDKLGYYTMTDKLDYPSLSQINKKLIETNVYIIFAVTKDYFELYNKVNKRLQLSTTGILENDSSNVVNLVKDQYDKITSTVHMLDNLLNSDNIKISYKSNCRTDSKLSTNTCHDVKLNTTVTFDVTVEVIKCPINKSEWNKTFKIYPAGLNEALTVEVEMICECECEKSSNEKKSNERCSNGDGTYQCGICNCHGSKSGKNCECDITNGDSNDNHDKCIRAIGEEPCSGAGECICGKCHCKNPSPSQKISGKYCQCKNYTCDNSCNAPNGICECGECKCKNGWTGKDCGCREDNRACIDVNDKICGERGTCDCGVCNCKEKYFGKFCDDCATCTEKCSEFRSCVDCVFLRLLNSEKGKNCNFCNNSTYVVEDFKVNDAQKEKLCTFEDENNCRVSFKYEMDNQNQPIIHVKKMKECPLPVNVMSIVSGVVGSIVGAGLLLLLMWKLLTTIHDRRELAKFEKERQKAKWDAGENPIYKQATSTFENPVYGVD